MEYLTFLLLLTILGLWFLWRKRKFSYFKNRGIPGPEPHFLFGNFLEFTKDPPLASYIEWSKKYGRVYGFYLGTIPFTVVSDPKLLKQIQISEFSKFRNRPLDLHKSFISKDPGNGFSTQLSILRDKKWKQLRCTLTPSFAPNRLKLMFPTVKDCINLCTSIIDEKLRYTDVVNAYDMYRSLISDIVGRSMFGTQFDCQVLDAHPLLNTGNLVANLKANSKVYILGYCFPELKIFSYLLFRIGTYMGDLIGYPLNKGMDFIKKVVNERRKQTTTKRNDILQFLLDVEKIDEADIKTRKCTEGVEECSDSAHELDNQPKLSINGIKRVKQLTEQEVFDNAFFLAIVGFETSSRALTYLTYFLAHYPEVQERARNEVISVIETEGNLDFSSLSQLHYLDQVIKESMRIIPPAHFATIREINEDTNLGGYLLEKGKPLVVPTYQLHHDEEFWTDPERFDPDRFSPENKKKLDPMVFQPFGAGPRICMATRFVESEMRHVIAKILLKYKILKCEKTPEMPLYTKMNLITISPPEAGLHVKLEAI